jgi:hypothetical protein
MCESKIIEIALEKTIPSEKFSSDLKLDLQLLFAPIILTYSF